MPIITDLEECAKAADPNVIGLAVNPDPSAVAINGWVVIERSDGLRVRIDTADGAPPTQAAIDAVLNADLTPAGITSRVTAECRSMAKAVFAELREDAMRDRAMVLVLKDEINLLRTRLRAQDAAVAGASTLAALKTAWAKLAASAPMPDRTAAQAKIAIENKIDSTDSD